MRLQQARTGAKAVSGPSHYQNLMAGRLAWGDIIVSDLHIYLQIACIYMIPDTLILFDKIADLHLQHNKFSNLSESGTESHTEHGVYNPIL